MKMGFLDVATEIRLQIYSELLVSSDPVEFIADFSSPSPPLFRSRKLGLCPAILGVCRKVYNEARPLLYSNNRFRFPGKVGSTPSVPDQAHIAPFLNQIGSQVRLLHHICIPFPNFEDTKTERAELESVHIENLELIRRTCTNIKTFKLLVPYDYIYAHDNWTITSEALELLDTRLKTMPSLEKVVVNLERQAASGEASDELTTKMSKIGWTVRVTRLKKRGWVTIDDEFFFAYKYDRDSYDAIWLRRRG